MPLEKSNWLNKHKAFKSRHWSKAIFSFQLSVENSSLKLFELEILSTSLIYFLCEMLGELEQWTGGFIHGSIPPGL